MKNNKKRAFFWTFFAIIAVFIFVMSAQNSDKSSSMSGGTTHFFVNLIPKLRNMSAPDKMRLIENLQFFVRKTAHWCIYFTLGTFATLAMLTYEIKLWKRPVIAAGICLIYAVSDEIHQLFVPGRSAEIRDVLIDFSGVLTAILIIMLIRKRRSVK